MKIEAKRTYYRPLTSDDVVQKYVDWLNDPDVNRYLEVRHVKNDIRSCDDFVRSVNNDENSHLFGIFDKVNDTHIGNIKIGPISRFKVGQLSLFIGDKSYWGKGIGSEAIATITNFAFNELNIEKVEAGCYETNLGSLRAFLKNNYQVDGFFRKHVLDGDKRIGLFWMSILKNERS